MAAAVALVAAACAGGSDVAEVPPTTSAVTVAPATSAVTVPSATSAVTVPQTAPEPEPGVHPCDLDTADVEDGFCLVDGQWWFDAGAGNWVESPGPTPTTTAAAATTDERDATAADDEPVEAPRDESLGAETTTNDADAVEEPTVPADVPATTVPGGETTEPEAQQPQPDQDEPQPEAPATEDGTERRSNLNQIRMSLNQKHPQPKTAPKLRLPPSRNQSQRSSRLSLRASLLIRWWCSGGPTPSPSRGSASTRI